MFSRAKMLEGLRYEEHFCEIIMNLSRQFRGGGACCIKISLVLALPAFCLMTEQNSLGNFSRGPYVRETFL